MLNYAAKLGPRNSYRFFHLDPDGDEPEVIAEIPVKHPGYVHSFGLTERHIVFAEFPWVVRPLDLATSTLVNASPCLCSMSSSTASSDTVAAGTYRDL